MDFRATDAAKKAMPTDVGYSAKKEQQPVSMPGLQHAEQPAKRKCRTA